ncbi:MAG: ankyrin repeat domain-containing protein, partial [Candidatus Accumulibacter sp.]|nr:ankyrin repeat domain-containing protein [Accumulibacter sp.]
MAINPNLLNAIRTGKLSEVLAVLNAGAVELNEADGKPGVALGMACFMGFSNIVRELIMRGAKANFPDNTIPTSPLSMALRGKHTEVVRTLVEMGVNIPPGIQTGLTEQEIEIARHVASKNAAASGEGSHFVIEEI